MHYPPSANSGYVPVAQAQPQQQVTQSSTSSSRQKKHEGGGRPNNAPVCVILEPTKELAQQTHDELGRFKKYLKNPEIK